MRNMFGEWKPIYDTYTFVSKGRWGTFFLNFSSIILFVLIFRCIIHYIKKVHAGIRILLISLIFYYLIWTVLSLDKAPIYHKKTNYIMYSSIIAAIINLILNYICINIFGYMAAAYTTLVAYIVLAGAQIIFARKVHLKETGEKSVYNDKAVLFMAILTIMAALFGLVYLCGVGWNYSCYTGNLYQLERTCIFFCSV